MSDIRTYTELNEEEKTRLREAWELVEQGLAVYEEITGAQLTDIVEDELWETIDAQKQEAEEVGR